MASTAQTESELAAIQLAGKTNSAFVFIKPHACKGTPGLVEAIVGGFLRKKWHSDQFHWGDGGRDH